VQDTKGLAKDVSPVLATEPERRLAAIVDFTFNLAAGRLQTSTLRRWVNHWDWVASGQELRRCVYGGKVLPGPVARDTRSMVLVRKCALPIHNLSVPNE